MLTLANECLANLHPNAQAMELQMQGTNGSIYAEALTFALAADMPRPQAEAQVKLLIRAAMGNGQNLLELALQSHPTLNPAALIANSLGMAPSEARAFAQAAADAVRGEKT
jgi:3-carboxy-cis,cis-muconate cycloisomerase